MSLFNFFNKKNNEDEFDEADVKVGARYFQVGGNESKWVIERIVKPIVSDVVHVVVVREGRHPSSKMVSISALLDTDIFRPERRDENDKTVERENKARRRSDTKVSR